MQANDALSPAEKALGDATTLIKPMKPQLNKHKDLLQNGNQQAQNAQDSADNAADEADSADEVRELLWSFSNCSLKYKNVALHGLV